MRRIGHAGGPTQNAAHTGVRFQSRDPLALLRNDGILLREFHTAQLVQNLLADGGSIGIGSSGVVRHVELHTVHRALRGAAAVGNLALEQVGVLQVLVADLADGVVGLAGDSSLLVVHTAHLGLKLVKAVGGAQVRFGDAVAIPVTPTTKTTAAKQREKQDPGEPTAAHAAPTFAVATGIVARYSRDVGCAHVIHSRTPFG